MTTGQKVLIAGAVLVAGYIAWRVVRGPRSSSGVIVVGAPPPPPPGQTDPYGDGWDPAVDTSHSGAGRF